MFTWFAGFETPLLKDELIIKEKKEDPPKKEEDKNTIEGKVDYLRFDISKKKIDFINGAENLKINRDKVLEESMTQFETINLWSNYY